MNVNEAALGRAGLFRALTVGLCASLGAGALVACGGDGGTRMLGEPPGDGDPGDGFEPPEPPEPTCKEGYAWDGAACADIDECAEGESACTQGCVNTKGAYECTCEAAYVLSDDGRTCVHECAVEDPCARGLTCVEAPGGHACEFRLAQLAVGARHTCGLTPKGLAYCWGEGWDGKLGTGNEEHAPRPTAVVMPAGVDKFVSIGAYFQNTCALAENDDLYCWGRGTTMRTKPELVTEGYLGVTQVHALASSGRGPAFLAEDGTSYDLSTWDFSLSHTGGAGDPPKVATLASGSGFFCGIGFDDIAWCWGSDAAGRLGDGPQDSGSSNGVAVAVQLPTGVSRFVQIAADFDYACAVGDDQGVYCWGEREYGPFGNEGTEDQTSPVGVPLPDGVAGVTQVTAGSGHACAITSEGRGLCWGSGFNSGLGTGKVYQLGEDEVLPVPIALDPSVRLAAIGAGDVHSCALDVEGKAYCWGARMYTGSDLDDSESTLVPVPVAAPL